MRTYNGAPAHTAIVPAGTEAGRFATSGTTLVADSSVDHAQEYVAWRVRPSTRECGRLVFLIRRARRSTPERRREGSLPGSRTSVLIRVKPWTLSTSTQTLRENLLRNGINTRSTTVSCRAPFDVVEAAAPRIAELMYSIDWAN